MPESDDRPAFTRDRPDSFASSSRPGAAVYQGDRPIDTAVVSPANLISSNGKLTKSMKQMGMKRTEGLFMRELANGAITQLEAWDRAFPRDKTSDSNRRHKASRMYRGVIAKLADAGIDEFELMGCGRTAVLRGVARSLEAKVVKAFIVPSTGQVVEAGPYEDNATRLAAQKLAAEMQGMVKQDKGGVIGQVIVNVVQYNPPGTPPWPGGGRS